MNDFDLFIKGTSIKVEILAETTDKKITKCLLKVPVRIHVNGRTQNEIETKIAESLADLISEVEA